MQGFTKDQIAVRSEGKEKGGFVPTAYNLYSPKSLAHINSLDDVLEERCIPQINRRALDPKIRDTWPTEKDDSFQKIRNLCYRLFLDYADEIYNLQDEARSLLSISGRELQLWTPIITLALFFEKHQVSGLVSKIKECVKQSSEDRQIQDEQDSRDLRVLKFVDVEGISLATNEDVIKNNPEGWIPITALNDHLRSNADKYEINTNYFTRHTLSETLRRLGFRQERKEVGVSWLITRNTVNEVKRRMGVDVLEDQSKTDLTLTTETTVCSVFQNLGTKSAVVFENQPKSKTKANYSHYSQLQPSMDEMTEAKTEQTVVFDKPLYLAELQPTTAKDEKLQPTTAKFEAKANHVDHVDDLKEHTLRQKLNKLNLAVVFENQQKSKTTAISGTFEAKTEQTVVFEQKTEGVSHSEAKTEQTVVFDKSLYLAELQPTTAKDEKLQPSVDEVTEAKTEQTEQTEFDQKNTSSAKFSQVQPTTAKDEKLQPSVDEVTSQNFEDLSSPGRYAIICKTCDNAGPFRIIQDKKNRRFSQKTRVKLPDKE